MTKKRTIKKQIFTYKKKYILWTVILMLVVLQALSAWHIMQLRKSADSYSGLSMRFLLKNAEEDRYKYPIIDVSENRVYIPEARIYLPLNEASRNMRYDYGRQSANPRPQPLYFSTSSVVGQQSDAKNASCDKMVTLASPGAAETRSNKPAGTVAPTKDGLSDVFTNPDTCWNQKWYAAQMQDLADVVKDAKNY